METKTQKVKIKIVDLGRDDFNGEFVFEGTFEEINEQLELECRKHLLSNVVSCSGNTIFAGFRPVGKIELIEEGFVDSVDKVELLNCFNCGDKMREGDGERWYHGDQDDLVCPDCASKLVHTDTSLAGLPVRRVE